MPAVETEARELAFRVSHDPVWASLVKAGREARAERNVIYPPGCWTDEDHVRYAIQRALAETYPELCAL